MELIGLMLTGNAPHRTAALSKKHAAVLDAECVGPGVAGVASEDAARLRLSLAVVTIVEQLVIQSASNAGLIEDKGRTPGIGRRCRLRTTAQCESREHMKQGGLVVSM